MLEDRLGGLAAEEYSCAPAPAGAAAPAVETGRTAPHQAVMPVARPAADAGNAEICSITICAIMVPVESRLLRPFDEIAITMSAAMPIKPTVRTNMATESSIRVMPLSAIPRLRVSRLDCR